MIIKSTKRILETHFVILMKVICFQRKTSFFFVRLVSCSLFFWSYVCKGRPLFYVTCSSLLFLSSYCVPNRRSYSILNYFYFLIFFFLWSHINKQPYFYSIDIFFYIFYYTYKGILSLAKVPSLIVSFL